MAKVLQMKQLCRGRVMFAVDGKQSSKIFEDRMKLYCRERNIEFRSINMSWQKGELRFEDLSIDLQKEKEKFEDLIKGRPDDLNHFHFDFVCDVTRELSQVVCVKNPMFAKPEYFPDNRNGFKIIQLTSV